jgi:hypothetical protein
MKSKSPFEEYSIYDINMPSSTEPKKIILAQLLPLKFAKYTIGIIFFLFCSPILVLFSEISPEDSELLSSVLLTECLLFLSFSLLAGIILSVFKNPKIQELKNLFGYIE